MLAHFHGVEFRLANLSQVIALVHPSAMNGSVLSLQEDVGGGEGISIKHASISSVVDAVLRQGTFVANEFSKGYAALVG